MKIRQVGAELFHAAERTDRLDEAKRRNSIGSLESEIARRR